MLWLLVLLWLSGSAEAANITLEDTACYIRSHFTTTTMTAYHHQKCNDHVLIYNFLRFSKKDEMLPIRYTVFVGFQLRKNGRFFKFYFRIQNWAKLCLTWSKDNKFFKYLFLS